MKLIEIKWICVTRHNDLLRCLLILVSFVTLSKVMLFERQLYFDPIISNNFSASIYLGRLSLVIWFIARTHNEGRNIYLFRLLLRKAAEESLTLTWNWPHLIFVFFKQVVHLHVDLAFLISQPVVKIAFWWLRITELRLLMVHLVAHLHVSQALLMMTIRSLLEHKLLNAKMHSFLHLSVDLLWTA